MTLLKELLSTQVVVEKNEFTSAILKKADEYKKALGDILDSDSLVEIKKIAKKALD